MEVLLRRNGLWLGLLALGLLVLVYLQQVQPIKVLSYSDFMRELNNDNIAELQVYGDHLEGTLNRALPDGFSRFVTTRVEPDFARDLQQHGVRFTGAIQTGFWRGLRAQRILR